MSRKVVNFILQDQIKRRNIIHLNFKKIMKSYQKNMKKKGKLMWNNIPQNMLDLYRHNLNNIFHKLLSSIIITMFLLMS